MYNQFGDTKFESESITIEKVEIGIYCVMLQENLYPIFTYSFRNKEVEGYV